MRDEVKRKIEQFNAAVEAYYSASDFFERTCAWEKVHSLAKTLEFLGVTFRDRRLSQAAQWVLRCMGSYNTKSTFFSGKGTR